MPQLDVQTTLLPSMMDRLLNPDSMGTRDQPGSTLREVFESVRDDLEDLLNTRRSREVPDKEYPEVARSVAWYGMPDFTSLDASTPGKQEVIGAVIEKIILQHEPRLRKLRATLIRTRGISTRVRFH